MFTKSGSPEGRHILYWRGESRDGEFLFRFAFAVEDDEWVLLMPPTIQGGMTAQQVRDHVHEIGASKVRYVMYRVVAPEIGMDVNTHFVAEKGAFNTKLVLEDLTDDEQDEWREALDASASNPFIGKGELVS